MKHSLRNNILKLDRPVPRYTSYPTAPHFKALPSKDLYKGWLKHLPENSNISLYLHVPFCPKMCWYCGCNTKVTQQYSPVESYTQLMIQEIKIITSVLNKKHNVTHIHFGGGSPGMLSPRDFNDIMKELRQSFTIDPKAEVAIEIDPRGVSEGKVATYAKNGVNRISLGVQDFDETVLKAVNREQPFHLSFKAVNLLKEYGIDKINMDLLYGLPHQTPETMKATIDKSLSLKPDRIALFGYAHVPWMKKHMRLIDETTLPDKNLRFDLFDVGATKLETAGYKAIGIDHFAKANDTLSKASTSGNLKRNFQGYTTDTTDIMIGIGASSIGQFNEGYTQNAVDMPTYKKSILSGELAVQKHCPISKEDALRAAVIESLMCNFKVNTKELCLRHGFEPSFLDKDIQSLKPYETQNFIKTNKDGSITIAQNARPIVRIICSAFDSYLDKTPKEPKHSSAV